MTMLVQFKRWIASLTARIEEEMRIGGGQHEYQEGTVKGKVRRAVGGVHEDCRVRRSPVAREKGSEGVK